MAMTKTSALLVEEFNAVMDNASKLIIGAKYTYAKLMETLGLPVKKYSTLNPYYIIGFQTRIK